MRRPRSEDPHWRERIFSHYYNPLVSYHSLGIVIKVNSLTTFILFLQTNKQEFDVFMIQLRLK